MNRIYVSYKKVINGLLYASLSLNIKVALKGEIVKESDILITTL
jgi:hypothetical protein